MNILFTSHRFYPDVGGIETHSEILCQAIHQAGHKLRLVTQTALPFGQSEAAFDFEILRRPSWRNLAASYRWADVVFQNNIELNVLLPWLTMRKPLVIALHTWIRSASGKRRVVDRVKQFILNLADDVVCVSDAIRSDSYAKARVIGNPYRSDLFRLLPDVRKKRAFVFVGRLVCDKGADLLIRAFAKVICDANVRKSAAECGYALELTIVGSGPEEHMLRSLARDCGVADSIHFEGRLIGDSLVRLLNQHYALVVPSRWREPFGIVALEGAACGCVIIGADSGGLSDAIGPTGVIFRRGEVEDLSLKMTETIVHRETAEKLRSAAAYHLQKHSAELISKQYLEVICSAALR